MITELVKKMTFSIGDFTFQCGKKINDLKMGYETYGTLNEEGTNAIFICAFHSSTSHAAGKYRETDKKSGYWDEIIGPGQLFDTDKYFIISSDNISNLQAFDPDVVTTGPSSINPETGTHYALDFPVFTTRDVVNVQYQLLRSLNVKKLAVVVGASLGGVNAFDWAVAYPDYVERVMSLAAAPVCDDWVIELESIWMDPIRLDHRWNNGNYYGKEAPVDGFALTMKMLTVASYSADWAKEKYGRKWANPENDPAHAMDNTFLIEKDITDLGYVRSKFGDANHMLYLNKMALLTDLGRGFPTYEDALKTIKAKILMVAVSSDQLFPLHHMKYHYEKLLEEGVKAEYFVIESRLGHMGILLDMAKMFPTIEKFLNS